MTARIHGLDGIRALAVLSVVVTHLGAFTWLKEHHPALDPLQRLLGSNTGVQTFFVLSGFLITHLLTKEYAAAGTINIRAFMARRALRILPLYMAFMVAVTALFLSDLNAMLSGDGRSLIHGWTFTYNLIPRSSIDGLTGHLWSLSVEEQFYLIWPFAFLALMRRGRSVVAFALIMFIVSYLTSLNIARPLEADFTVFRWPMIAGRDIALGALLALAPPDIRRVIASRAGLLLAAALLAGSIYTWPNNTTIAYTLLIGWVAWNQRSTAVRVLSWRPLAYLGTISYGIYMWQGFFLATNPRRWEGLVWPLDPVIGLALLAVVAPLSYAYLEKPFLRLKRRKTAAPNTGELL